MEDEKKIDFLWKVMGRYDTYYTSTNTKASVGMAFNAIVFAGLVSKWADIMAVFNSNSCLNRLASTLLALIGLASLVSLFFMLRVIFPYLKSEPPKARPEATPRPKDDCMGIVFFGDVAQLDSSRYCGMIQKLDEDCVRRNLCTQVFVLAVGLNEKFNEMAKGISVIYYVILPCSIMLLTLLLLQYFK